MNYTLEDLPRFSPWPARLLGIEPWSQKTKTPNELEREYELEKWGKLWNQVQACPHPLSLDAVDDLAWETKEGLCLVDGSFQLLSVYESHSRYIELVEETLRMFLPAPSLVELGAGYGTVILKLAQRKLATQFVAGEFTQSGIELMRALSRSLKLDLKTDRCDYFNLDLGPLEIPADSVVFTSFSACCVSELDETFVRVLADLSPRAVIHFEPCYEHYPTTTLHGLLCRRYIDVNAYNRNLLGLLKKMECQGSIIIERESPMVFGSNPLLPASILVWRPKR